MQLSTDSFDNARTTLTTNANAVDQASTDLPVEAGGVPYLAGSIPRTEPPVVRTSWRKWYAALKNVLPIYIAIHLALFTISCLAFLFTNKDFSSQIMPISTLWTQWHHWDTGVYMRIALHGYDLFSNMAFYPLYPLLERGFMAITGGPLTAGLIVSNVAELILFVVLYRLLEEDFNGERAYHSILYFAIFPSAFFLSAAYTESLFLCLSVLSFYHIRRERWWLAGLFGGLASLTRPDAMFLLVPFCYEYLRRIWPQQVQSLRSIFSRELLIRLLKSFRFDILAGLCLPAGIALFMLYGYYQFHDPLAFVHAHAYWGRFLSFPGWGMLRAAWKILQHGLLSFEAMRTLIDLGTDLLVLLLIFLSFIGPWKLPKTLWSYGLYAAARLSLPPAFPQNRRFPAGVNVALLTGNLPGFHSALHDQQVPHTAPELLHGFWRGSLFPADTVLNGSLGSLNLSGGR